jgi:hypothetical protein
VLRLRPRIACGSPFGSAQHDKKKQANAIRRTSTNHAYANHAYANHAYANHAYTNHSVLLSEARRQPSAVEGPLLHT